MVVGAIVYTTTQKRAIQDNDSVKEEAIQNAKNVFSSANGDNYAGLSIYLICKATYYGGHKKYGEKTDVSLVLTNDMILIKEISGIESVRIEIPYKKISDFGVVTKEPLTLGRMLLVGILAFALKKEEQYLYVKFLDSLGFENNPLFGGFKNKTITEVNSKLYFLIESARKVECQ